MINKNKNLNLREKDKKGKTVIAVLLLIAIIGVGYATLGANLKINGVANIPSASWDVHFKTGSINVTTGSVEVDTTNNEQAATITNPTQVDYAVKLALPGDFYEFTVTAENTGSIDAMIDSVVSKRGDTVITTGTLPSYIDYSITYADGITISPKHLLAASSEETYKVRIAYKTDIEANELPQTAETLNLNFQINYVQADNTAIVKPIPPFTGIKYGVYPPENKLYLNQAVPANAILHSTPSDALADWTNPSVMNTTSKPFYLKHIIENDIVTESYVCFEKNSTDYCIKGGDSEASFLPNAKIIFDAFEGENCSGVSNLRTNYDSSYNPTPISYFMCSDYSLFITTDKNGKVEVAAYSWRGIVYNSGESACYNN